MIRLGTQWPLRRLNPAAKRVSAAPTRPNALELSARLSTASPPGAKFETNTKTGHDKAPAESPMDLGITTQKREKTIAELDEELRLKLEGISGDGGASGVEYEGGKAEGLKRGVKDNMFRVI
ncbi:hypothetical protein CORC01_01656 [Colletotrichum orchidophilum]|uniref:Uncharacterized protein n=1 Tax=Colletotrichum orchidophilum TaxID=1209926 RepID=A0A1G4BNK8_9PEZI|nr:uncharacterized protein CORC01_01656 [Colletotrichum orchidophilum]OHF02898.1 hypothetical protein CORC01_01656 [Colletotrichum orchidophilum]